MSKSKKKSDRRDAENLSDLLYMDRMEESLSLPTRLMEKLSAQDQGEIHYLVP